MSECDFCQRESEHLHPINDGLWAICDICMDIEYDMIPKALRIKSSKPDDPVSPRLSLKESYSKFLDTLDPGEEE